MRLAIVIDLIRTGNEIPMNTAWIEKRLAKFQERLRDENLKRVREEKAVSSIPALYHNLKTRVSENVKEYNHAFAQYEECQVQFDEGPTLFWVDGTNGHVEAVFDGTVIRVTRQGSVSDGISVSTITAKPNKDGDPVYFKNDKELDVIETARLVLDSVLCV